MTRPAKVVLPVSVALILALLIGIVVATRRDGFFYPDGIVQAAATLWGQIVLFDFSISLVFVGLWIFAVDKNRTRAALVTVFTFLGGNAVFLVYLTYRAFRVESFEELLLARR